MAWPTLMDIPDTVDEAYDNQGRKWEREGWDWVTYGSFIQRWSTAVTDLSGWGPFSRTQRNVIGLEGN